MNNIYKPIGILHQEWLISKSVPNVRQGLLLFHLKVDSWYWENSLRYFLSDSVFNNISVFLDKDYFRDPFFGEFENKPHIPLTLYNKSINDVPLTLDEVQDILKFNKDIRKNVLPKISISMSESEINRVKDLLGKYIDNFSKDNLISESPFSGPILNFTTHRDSFLFYIRHNLLQFTPVNLKLNNLELGVYIKTSKNMLLTSMEIIRNLKFIEVIIFLEMRKIIEVKQFYNDSEGAMQLIFNFNIENARLMYKKEESPITENVILDKNKMSTLKKLSFNGPTIQYNNRPDIKKVIYINNDTICHQENGPMDKYQPRNGEKPNYLKVLIEILKRYKSDGQYQIKVFKRETKNKVKISRANLKDIDNFFISNSSKNVNPQNGKKIIDITDDYIKINNSLL